jgi:hypothetical protein
MGSVEAIMPIDLSEHPHIKKMRKNKKGALEQLITNMALRSLRIAQKFGNVLSGITVAIA